MKEVFSMWRHTKMVVLVALSAAIYAAVLIPFKGFVLIPGFTEFRPAGVLPVVLGLLFGPAGAWGAAFGNLIGDFFGTLTIGSIFGFIGNFFFAFVPYKLWNKLGLVDSNDKEQLLLNNAKKTINYMLVAVLGSLSCALIISWGLEFLHLVPFAVLAGIISINNSLPAVILGIPLMLILYPRIKRWDLLWTEIVDEQELQVHNALSALGAAVMIIGIVGGLVAGFAASLGLDRQVSDAASVQINHVHIVIWAGVGVALNVVGGLLRKRVYRMATAAKNPASSSGS